MLSIRVEGDRALVARLTSMPAAVRDALRRKVLALGQQVRSREITGHLSGPTGEHSLSVGPNTDRHTGGQLRRSVFTALEVDEATSVQGKVAFGADVPYAAIHEHGGKINIPEMVPSKAQAFHFFTKAGVEVYSKRIRAHTVNMPARATLRTTLAEMAPEIKMGLEEAVNEALRHK